MHNGLRLPDRRKQPVCNRHFQHGLLNALTVGVQVQQWRMGISWHKHRYRIRHHQHIGIRRRRSEKSHIARGIIGFRSCQVLRWEPAECVRGRSAPIAYQ